MPEKVKLKVVAGALTGKEFEFTGHDTFLFGRTSQCHVSLPSDSFISRHHFILEANPPNVRVRDLGSLNGTYVNEKMCGKRDAKETPEEGAKREFPSVDLKHGDLIEVGETRFEIDIDRTEDHGEQGPIRCRKCDREVGDEVGNQTHGAYVCEKCRETDEGDPFRLYLAMLEYAQDKGESVENQSVGSYTLERKLGQGGMGAVYLVRHSETREHAALKMVISRVAVDDEPRDLFLREMQVLRSLNHPNIVRFTDCGSAGSAFYFVMEYCDRGNLFDLCAADKGLMTTDLVLPMLRDSLRGLAHAHEMGFVHRDIKPSNILLCEDEGKTVAKVSDFGLSKSFELAGLSGMTATGAYGGTARFMAREQLTHYKYVRPTSDVWSLGATFYWLLTRELPREEKPGQDPLDAVLSNNVIPITERRPDLPPALVIVLDRALALDPENRFASGGEMLEALERI